MLSQRQAACISLESKQCCLHCILSCDRISTSSCSLHLFTSALWTLDMQAWLQGSSHNCIQDSVYWYLQLPAWWRQYHCITAVYKNVWQGVESHDLTTCPVQLDCSGRHSLGFLLCGLAAKWMKCQSLHACTLNGSNPSRVSKITTLKWRLTELSESFLGLVVTEACI